eukprot:Sspe_Gene.39937::Locus_19246_Transcript_10_10_Confidence_0.370_Length_588::g.39937::m.39937/K10419/DYNLRB, DNCL2; dynein light chain roadblock-type
MAQAQGPTPQQVQQKVVEDTLTRIANHQGVLGLLVVNPRDGSVWKAAAPQGGSWFDEKKAATHAEKIHAFVNLTRSIVRTLSVENELTFLRLRSKKHEFIISPEKDFLLVVIQDYRVRAEEERNALRRDKEQQLRKQNSMSSQKAAEEAPPAQDGH